MPIPVSFAYWCLPRDLNSEHLVPETSASSNCARKAFIDGAQSESRTRTSLLTLPPQGSVSAISTTWAYWCVMSGSNRRHPLCRSGALPSELTTRVGFWRRGRGSNSHALSDNTLAVCRLTDSPHLSGLCVCIGLADRSRTHGLRVRSTALFQLSYSEIDLAEGERVERSRHIAMTICFRNSAVWPLRHPSIFWRPLMVSNHLPSDLETDALPGELKGQSVVPVVRIERTTSALSRRRSAN